MSKKVHNTKIAEDAAKRFRMLCEYTFNITEDDGEQEPEVPIDDTQNNMEGMDGTGEDMNNMMSPEGENNNPNMSTNEPNNQDMSNTEGGAPGFNPIEGGDEPMDDTGNIDDTEQGQPDDEVIDVDDLTQSQEKTEEKVDNIHVTMEKGFDKLLKIVNRLDKLIDSNTSNMEQIRQEIEKRNPTPIEKLNMRAANDSYPFNISPNDYWKNKEATSNYRIGGENEEDAKQYTITQGDIDKINDFQRISKELDSSEFNQNLMNIFGL